MKNRSTGRVVRVAGAGIILGALLTVSGAALPADAGARTGTWAWPVAHPTVVSAYSPPATRYSAGHRGIDLDAPVGTAITAPADGVVVFAGQVGDRPVLSLSHAGGIISSYEPVLGAVPVGHAVHSGEVVGVMAAAPSHCASACLHFGVRKDGSYLSPVALIGEIERAVLLPLGGEQELVGRVRGELTGAVEAQAARFTRAGAPARMPP